MEKVENDTSYQITAFKNFEASQIGGTVASNYASNEKIRTAYDVQYDYEADIIYLAISMFDDEDNLISIKVEETFPIYYEDGSYDAQFAFDGKVVFLSEIITGQNDSCFFFSITLSLLAAKIIAAAIIAAKVVVVVTGVVAVGYVTYQVASLTKEKIRERERSEEKEKQKKNPRVYYPATRKGGKLLIASAPYGLIEASKQIVKNVDFWSPNFYNAKALAITASGSYVGPEVDSNKNGYYYHYHLAGRRGGHSFFGTPTGGVY